LVTVFSEAAPEAPVAEVLDVALEVLVVLVVAGVLGLLELLQPARPAPSRTAPRAVPIPTAVRQGGRRVLDESVVASMKTLSRHQNDNDASFICRGGRTEPRGTPNGRDGENGGLALRGAVVLR
jgi:hypothetical protein